MIINILDQDIIVTILDDDTVQVNLLNPNQQQQSALEFQDEGITLGTIGTVTKINFVGSSVVASRTGSTVTINVSGGASGTGDVVGPTGAAADNIASFSGATGKIIKDSGLAKDATGGFAGLTLFKINFKNVANTFISFFTNSNTAARTYTFMDRDGTIQDCYNYLLKGTTANRRHTNASDGASISSGNLTINSLRGQALMINAPITIDKISCEVTTGTSGKIRLMIFASDTNGNPGALVAESGELTITTPAVYEGLSVASVTLLPGLYHLAYLTDTANTVRAYNQSSTALNYGFPVSGFTNMSYVVISALTYGAAPDPFTAGFAYSASGTAMVICFRVI